MMPPEPMNGGHLQPPPRTEQEAIDECNATYLKMARDARQAGREIPAQEVPASAPGARWAVEASQRLMRRSRTSYFTVPDLPWKRKKSEGD